MKRSTLAGVLSVLDAQAAHMATIRTPEQRAYWEGMITMLNLIVSENCTVKRGIERDSNGHFAKMANGQIVRGNRA